MYFMDNRDRLSEGGGAAYQPMPPLTSDEKIPLLLLKLSHEVHATALKGVVVWIFC